VKPIFLDDLKAQFIARGVPIPVFGWFTWSSGRIGYVHEESLLTVAELTNTLRDWCQLMPPSFFGSSDKHNGAVLLNHTAQRRGVGVAYRFLNR